MQMPWLITWLEMVMTCSQPTVREELCGEIKIQLEVVLSILKVSLFNYGTTQEQGQECSFQACPMVR